MKLDFDNPDKDKTREAVLKVARKVVDLSNSNSIKNADRLIATNKDILWVGKTGKLVSDNLHALSY